MPLIKLLKKIPIWTTICSHAFNILKTKLVFAPILLPPNLERGLYTYLFANFQLVQVERNYIVTEREALGMIFSIQEFVIIFWKTNLFFMLIRMH